MKKITIWLLCLSVLLSGCTTEKIYIIQTCEDNKNVTVRQKEKIVVRGEDRMMECYWPWWDRWDKNMVYPLYHSGYYERVPADNSPWSWWSEQCR